MRVRKLEISNIILRHLLMTPCLFLFFVHLDGLYILMHTRCFITVNIWEKSNDDTVVICIIFERNVDAINGILINYHLMCATLVIVASINFVIDPIVVPGRAGLLVTVYLVLSTFFSDAQVRSNYFHLCLLSLRFFIDN